MRATRSGVAVGQFPSLGVAMLANALLQNEKVRPEAASVPAAGSVRHACAAL